MKKNIALRLGIWRTVGSQAALATLTEISEARVSRLVTGRAQPTRAERQRIATVVGERVDVLFPGIADADAEGRLDQPKSVTA